jgi:hypothetical protein
MGTTPDHADVYSDGCSGDALCFADEHIDGCFATDPYWRTYREATAARLLGIAPETLRRRLTYGERVEQATDVLDRTVLKSAYRDAQRDLLAWLTRPAGSSGTETP